jgi:hypothetical protein
MRGSPSMRRHLPIHPANRACDPSKPFDPPVALTELNSTVYDGNAWLSTDLLTIYFESCTRAARVVETTARRARA